MEQFDFEKINDVISKLTKSNPKNLHTSVTVNSSGKTDSIVEFEFASLRNSEINNIITKILESTKESWNGKVYLGSEKLKLNHVTSNILSFKVDTDTFVEMLNEGSLSDSIDSNVCELYTKKIPIIVKSIIRRVGVTVSITEYRINIYRYASEMYDTAKGELIGVYSGKPTDPVTDSELKDIIFGAGYSGSYTVFNYTKGTKGELVAANTWDFSPKEVLPGEVTSPVYTFANLFEDWGISGTEVDVLYSGQLSEVDPNA